MPIYINPCKLQSQVDLMGIWGGGGEECVVASESGCFHRGDFKNFFLLRWKTGGVNGET